MSYLTFQCPTQVRSLSNSGHQSISEVWRKESYSQGNLRPKTLTVLFGSSKVKSIHTSMVTVMIHTAMGTNNNNNNSKSNLITPYGWKPIILNSQVKLHFKVFGCPNLKWYTTPHHKMQTTLLYIYIHSGTTIQHNHLTYGILTFYEPRS